MKKISVILFVLLTVVSCEKFAMPDTGPQISKHGEDESHNKGLNCMTCHYTVGQDVEGVFSVGGSVYGNTNNANVEFYSSPGANEPFHIVEVDQFGNFYTTESINFDGGIYVAVRAANGDVQFMEDPIFNGQCNLCHGTNVEERIVID